MRNDTCTLLIALVTLIIIFLIFSKDRYSTPLNFDTFFGVDGSNPFSRRVIITQRGEIYMMDERCGCNSGCGCNTGCGGCGNGLFGGGNCCCIIIVVVLILICCCCN